MWETSDYEMYVAEFSYQTYHGWICIDICDCVNGWASFSAILSTYQSVSGTNPAMNMP